jgi:hypothetical protein
MAGTPHRHTDVPTANYRLYRARRVPRTYLVVSTYVETGGRPEVPDPDAFEERGAMQALLGDLARTQAVRPGVEPARPRRRRAALTLWVHGFNSRLGDFARALLQRADSREDSLRPRGRVLVGYRWPSEGLLSGRSLADTARALFSTAIVGLGLVLLPLAALDPHGHRWLAGGPTGPVAAALRPLLWPYASRVCAGLLLGAGLVLAALRLSTYLRDRYRALHYGVPDLCEFVRDLETGLAVMDVRVALDMVGHSMGALTLVNAVRLMSEFFHRPGAEGRTIGYHGDIELRTLVLAAPDIPAALASPGRNNYFLAALRRFRSVHVLSSDRDIVLKWASTLLNWASEPDHEMAGRHLGNVYLARAASVPAAWRPAHLAGDLVPLLRPQARAFPAVTGGARPPGGRLAWVHFHDCSACPSLGADGGRPALVALTVVLALAALHLWLGAAWTLWLVSWGALLFGLGALARWLPGWRDWRVAGPWLGALADWPSLVGFARRANPHGGYFVPGSEPRRLVARLLARPLRPGGRASPPELAQVGPLIRTAAVGIEV